MLYGESFFGHWVLILGLRKFFLPVQKHRNIIIFFLTKNPERFADLQNNGKLIVADNMWYGASATNEDRFELAAKTFSDLNCQTKTFFKH